MASTSLSAAHTKWQSVQHLQLEHCVQKGTKGADFVTVMMYQASSCNRAIPICLSSVLFAELSPSPSCLSCFLLQFSFPPFLFCLPLVPPSLSFLNPFASGSLQTTIPRVPIKLLALQISDLIAGAGTQPGIKKTLTFILGCLNCVRKWEMWSV